MRIMSIEIGETTVEAEHVLLEECSLYLSIVLIFYIIGDVCVCDK
jgi:hypothetical protein